MKRQFLTAISALTMAISAQASWVSTYNEWTDMALGQRYISNGNYISDISSSEDLVSLRRNYGSVPFYNIVARLSSTEIQINNENVIKLSKEEADFSSNLNGYRPSPDALEYVSDKQITTLYNAMRFHPNVANQRKYGGRGVGFCFGRALIVHNEAMARNVHPNAIRKIWVVGDMGFWGHHVATIVKTKNDWIAVDNYTGIMNVENWIKRMKREQKGSKELMFFITRAGRFSHQTNYLYNPIDLFNVPQNRLSEYASDEARAALKSRDFYKGFFMDYYAHLEDDIPAIEKFEYEEAPIAIEEPIAADRSIEASSSAEPVTDEGTSNNNQNDEVVSLLRQLGLLFGSGN